MLPPSVNNSTLRPVYYGTEVNSLSMVNVMDRSLTILADGESVSGYARARLLGTERLGLYKYLGRSYEEMDCQAFVEKCMADVGYRRDLGGSNSWYRECMKQGWVGTPEECMKQFGSVPKGALLFILEPVGLKTPAKFRDDGVGDVTHMGIVTGRNDEALYRKRLGGYG